MLKTIILCASVLFSIIVNAQQIRNLVFEGAGIRGIAYAGALAELEKNHLTDNIIKVAGTSAGGITALAFSLGYKSDEIAELISNTDFGKFNDGQYVFIGGIYRMGKKFGWYKSDAFVKWLEKVIYTKTGNANITFSELHQKGFKDLYITAVSLNNQKEIVFSRHTYPNMKVKDAVRITMSVPLYFEAICIDPAGKIIDKPSTGNKYDLVVDGGITSNFPIHIFDSTIIKNEKASRIANNQTIGIRIDTDEQINSDSLNAGLAAIEINTLGDYVNAFYSYVLENLNRQSLTKEDWNRTISVSSVGIGPKVKQLKKQQKERLINSGKRSVQQYINNNQIH